MLVDDLAFWRLREAWERVAGGFRSPLVHGEAVKPLPGDPKVSNRHALEVGDLHHLQTVARKYFLITRRWCGFTGYHEWDRQRDWLESLFGHWFQRGGEVGWVSLFMAYRPAPVRHELHDSKVVIVSRRGAAPPAIIRDARHLDAGPLRLSLAARPLFIPTKGLYLCCREQRLRRKGQIFAVDVPRAVHAPDFGVHNVTYNELRICHGLYGEDDERLRKCEVPAEPAPRTSHEAQLRTNPILNLFRISLRHMKARLAAAQIDRVSGGVLSLRYYEAPLDGCILLSGLAERVGITEALQAGIR